MGFTDTYNLFRIDKTAKPFQTNVWSGTDVLEPFVQHRGGDTLCIGNIDDLSAPFSQLVDNLLASF